MSAPRYARRGFTLIELLVAISILAIIAVLGWRGLDSIVRARLALTADLDQTRGMQLAFAQMQSDCGLIAQADILTNRTSVLWQQGSLVLVRKAFSENLPTQLQVVSYRLKGGALVRNESAATRNLNQLNEFWQAALADTDSSNAVILKDGVDAINVLRWEGGGWQPYTAPVPDAPAAQMPTGLQVTLVLHDQQLSLIKAFLLGAV